MDRFEIDECPRDFASLATLPRSPVERLFDAIELPIGCWDTEWRLRLCNAPYLRWAGRDREQLIGRTLAELYGEAAWAAARSAFHEALSGREASYERLLTHRDGPPRWMRAKVFPEVGPDGVVHTLYTIAFDIHDDVMQHEALQAAQRRLDRFTDNIPYPLSYVDPGCVIRFVNKAYCQAAGKTVDELVGHEIEAARGSAYWEEHRAYFARALAGESAQFTRLAQSGTHGPRWLRTSYEPDCDAFGEVLGVYTVTIDVHEMTLAQEHLRRRVERDALTQVLSRHAIIERIEAALPGSAERPLALFFVDLDGFKEINDTLGHRAGDRLLAAVGRALQDSLRADDCVGRFGGDEFIVLARVRDQAGARALALHLLQAVQRAAADDAGAPAVGASIGYALAPGDAEQTLHLIQRADEAMYLAKNQGRNRAAHCDEAG